MSVAGEAVPRYLLYHLVFVVPVVALLFAAGTRRINRVDGLGVSILVPVAVLYATPWDSYLIRQGVWWYGDGSVLVRIWHVPLGEYLFFVLQTLLTGLVVSHLPTTAGQSGDQTVGARLVGLTAGALVGAVGVLALGTTSTFYLGAILVWGAPVLAIQWVYDWQYLWKRRRVVGLAVLVPTLYLATTDLVAISAGIWQIAPRYTTGLELFGLPVEEAVFFLMTNTFVVQGLVLFRGLVERDPVRDRLTGTVDIPKRTPAGPGYNDNVKMSKQIQQRTGKTFHVATRLFPRRIRRATYVLYAFFRVADEVVDDPDPGTPASQRRRLEEIRDAAKGVRDTDDPVLQAFTSVRESSGIQDREIDEFVDAMVADTEKRRYETRAQLEAYVRGSAVAVANMMLAVTDTEHVDAAGPHAAALGNAFQLTNFLRDVREDVVQYDRIYIPETVRRTHGVTEAQIREREFTGEFADLMREELQRVEERYRKGVAGIEYLPDGCQFAVVLAAILYADHHRLIRNRGYDTLTATPELSMRRRLSLVVRAWVAWVLTKDPERTFYRVSAVSRSREDGGTDAASEPRAEFHGREIRQ